MPQGKAPKFNVGDELILIDNGNRYKCKVLRYQDNTDHLYVVEVPSYPFRKLKIDKEYGAKEEQLRPLTKLDRALK